MSLLGAWRPVAWGAPYAASEAPLAQVFGAAAAAAATNNVQAAGDWTGVAGRGLAQWFVLSRYSPLLSLHASTVLNLHTNHDAVSRVTASL